MSLPYGYVGSIASNQTKEFFRPRNLFEQIYLILSISWFFIAFLGTIDLQAYLFFGIVFLILVNHLYLFLYNKPRSSFLNTTLKLTFFFFLFILFRPEAISELIFYSITITNIILVQKTILVILMTYGLIAGYFRFELLKKTSKKKVLENYTDFAFQIIKGIGYGLYLIIFFDLVSWIPPLVTSTNQFPNVQDILLIIGSLLLIIASQGPEGSDLKNIFAKELFLVNQTRFERLRDSILKVSIFLLIYLKIVPFFTVSHKTLVTEAYWSDAAVLLFLVGIITLFLSFFESEESKKKGFMDYAEDVSNSLNGELSEKFSSFSKSVQDLAINPQEQQFFKLTDDLPLINKGNSKFTAKKNSIAIPLKKTQEGTSVVFVGENDVENVTDEGVVNKNKLEEAATAIIIPNDIWDKANLSLEAFKPTDETIKALTLKGIESKEKLLSLAEGSLADFRNIKGSQIVKQKFQGMVSNFQKGKYFVSETAKGTFLRLPGITVIDNKETTFVRVFGIKVLEAEGYTVVNMPFIKVVESPDYQLVKLPGINVIEAGKSNLVNIMGFQILDGDHKEIEMARNKIEKESLQLNNAFDKLDTRLNSVYDNPDTFLLAKTGSGDKLELLAGQSSEKAIISSNLLALNDLKQSGITSNLIKLNNNPKRKVKPDKVINSKNQLKDQTTHNYSKPTSEQEKDKKLKTEKDRLVKLHKIAKMSQESIDLERLSKFLEFASVEALENWLVNSNIQHLQINWSENKLFINSDFINALEKALD